MSVGRPHGLLLTQENEGSCSWLQVIFKHKDYLRTLQDHTQGTGSCQEWVRHASWLPAVRAGEWTDAQTGVHSNLRGGEGVRALPWVASRRVVGRHRVSVRQLT